MIAPVLHLNQIKDSYTDAMSKVWGKGALASDVVQLSNLGRDGDVEVSMTCQGVAYGEMME